MTTAQFKILNKKLDKIIELLEKTTNVGSDDLYTYTNPETTITYPWRQQETSSNP